MNRNLLGECRACGREVSRRTSECPDCREPSPTLTEQEYQKTYQIRISKLIERSGQTKKTWNNWYDKTI